MMGRKWRMLVQTQIARLRHCVERGTSRLLRGSSLMGVS